MSPREHLNWCVQRALEYYDVGDQTNAIASFMSDIRKHEGTAWIFGHDLTFPMLMMEVGRGRDAFKRAMTGFSVGGVS